MEKHPNLKLVQYVVDNSHQCEIRHFIQTIIVRLFSDKPNKFCSTLAVYFGKFWVQYRWTAFGN